MTAGERNQIDLDQQKEGDLRADERKISGGRTLKKMDEECCDLQSPALVLKAEASWRWCMGGEERTATRAEKR